MTADQVRQKSEAEQDTARQLFMDKLEVDNEIAQILVQEGFSSVEEIAYVPTAELLASKASTRTSSRSCAHVRAMRS